MRGLDGAVDQRRVTLGDPPDDGAVVGALDLAPLAGLEPLAGDEELVIDRLHVSVAIGAPPLAFRIVPA